MGTDHDFSNYPKNVDCPLFLPNSLGTPHEETKAYDEKLIGAIYNERGRKIVGGTLNGQLYYFSKNSVSVQSGVAERFLSEKAKAQGRLKDENSY